MYKITARGFGEGDGLCVPFLDLMSKSVVSNLWQQKQQESLEEYFAEEKAAPESTRVLYDLFAGYIARAIHGRTSLRILDVGCGVRNDYPPYAAFLAPNRQNDGHLYVGLDPIPHNVAGRNYPFICGKLEDLPAVIDEKFDVFLFSTSLDHVENIETAASAVR
ncbi:MAG: class I SAM-dependent methyltransferase, partial [Pyrinomonadaceae bacterium]